MMRLLVSLLLLGGSAASGAIALDATSSGALVEGVGNQTSSYAHTTGSGSGRLLVVTISGYLEAGTITAVAYNGAACTKVAGTGDIFTSEVWYLVSPASGTHDVVVNWTPFTQVYESLRSAAVSFTGVDTVPINVSAHSTGVISQAVTTTVASTWLVGTVISQNGTLTPATGQAEFLNTAPGSGVSSMASGYIGPVSSGSNTMTWTVSGGSGAKGIALVAIQQTGSFVTTGTARRSYGQ